MPQHREISLIRYLHKPPNQREEIQNKPLNPLCGDLPIANPKIPKRDSLRVRRGKKSQESFFLLLVYIWSGTQTVGQKILFQNEGLFFFDRIRH